MDPFAYILPPETAHIHCGATGLALFRRPSVALDGNSALIGAYGDSSSSGSAYLYASTSSSSSTQSQVPGPLPLLELGAAFAWSRKLRRRIHTHTTQRSVRDGLPSLNERH